MSRVLPNDGKVRHVVADISFADAWVRCDCGTVFRGLDIASDFSRHRLAMGFKTSELKGIFRGYNRD